VRQLRAFGFSPHRQLGDPWENPLRTGVALWGAHQWLFVPSCCFPFYSCWTADSFGLSIGFIHFTLSSLNPLGSSFLFTPKSASKDDYISKYQRWRSLLHSGLVIGLVLLS
jgi:hypothetical protein